MPNPVSPHVVQMSRRSRPLPRQAFIRTGILLASSLLLSACGGSSGGGDTATAPDTNSGNGPTTPEASPLFTNDSAQLKGFARPNGSDGLGAAAWFDFDNDLDLDLIITNRQGQNNGLFRNNGDSSFTEVAVAAGVANGLGNMGVVAADINNDGFQDLFLAGEGGIGASLVHSPVKLYLNNQNGTFSDITAASGVVGAGTPYAAAFGDINNDGFVDLFIVNNGSFTTGVQHPSQLFLNNGDNTFTDISTTAGIDSRLGGCVVTFSDFDVDGLIDIIVGNCNDLLLRPTPFEVFRNNGDTTFTSATQDTFLTRLGLWMSVTLGDIDNDGDLDLFSSNLGKNIAMNPDGSLIPGAPILSHVLYRNNGGVTYTDIAATANMGANSNFSWGSAMADFNNDGWLDLVYQGNFPKEFNAGPGTDAIGPILGNPGFVYLNQTNSKFALAQTLGLENHFTSGLAIADYNLDGFADIAVVATQTTQTTQQPGRPFLFTGKPNANNWTTVKLTGTTSNRDAIGAVAKVVSLSNQIRQVTAGGGFASMDSLWLTFGLGAETGATVTIRVRWPSGAIEDFTASTRQLNSFTEGTGVAQGSF